ncbi:MAG: HpaII family restriction endonuclease [Clostridiales bacterium]|jgi:hypothetical protein|nr:HpaII family restriction endonuclease [Clostridiales bacterium]
MSANRGEWAELYVIFKLLGEGKIYAADEKLVKNPNSYLAIIKIIREEVKNRLIEYKTGMTVEICLKDRPSVFIPAIEFLNNAQTLLDTIKSSSGRSFDILPETDGFKNRALITKFKSPSNGYYEGFGGKNDIIIETYDHETALRAVAGFSIKSKYNCPATLFNASEASAFVYELKNITDSDMLFVNSLFTQRGGIDKQARISFFKENNVDIEFSHIKFYKNTGYSIFADNLDIVRGDMIEVLNAVIMTHYFIPSNTRIADITRTLIEKNPLNKRNPENYYPKAIKDFLYASFSGMTAATKWNGLAVVNGGYISANLDSGEVLVFHTRSGEPFRSFLFENTKIDRPSASEQKHDYAKVYKDDGKYYFDLNFQVRFID